jgi:hypothetical protein
MPQAKAVWQLKVRTSRVAIERLSIQTAKIMFNIFRMFLNMFIESYALSILLFGIFSHFWDKNAQFLNKINRIGIVLAILGVLDQISSINLSNHPVRNYDRVDLTFNPFYYQFRIAEICLFMVVAIIFWERKRREKWFFTKIGLLFLLLPNIISEIQRYSSFLKFSNHHFTIYTQLFNKNSWWFVSGVSAIFLAGVFLRVNFLGRRN